MSIALAEEGNLDEAYYSLKQSPENGPHSDFQLHFLYILQHFITHDTSQEAVSFKSLLKNEIREAADEESKVL